MKRISSSSYLYFSSWNATVFVFNADDSSLRIITIIQFSHKIEIISEKKTNATSHTQRRATVCIGYWSCVPHYRQTNKINKHFCPFRSFLNNNNSKMDLEWRIRQLIAAKSEWMILVIIEENAELSNWFKRKTYLQDAYSLTAHCSHSALGWIPIFSTILKF